MSNGYINLLGYENVERAGRNMLGAAEQFERNVQQFGFEVDRLQRILEEHANRVEAAMEKKE